MNWQRENTICVLRVTRNSRTAFVSRGPITELNPSEQQALLDKVAQLNFQKGLHDLAEKYRARLARQNQLTSPPEQVWIELHRIRAEIAEHDYPS